MAFLRTQWNAFVRGAHSGTQSCAERTVERRRARMRTFSCRSLMRVSNSCTRPCDAAQLSFQRALPHKYGQRPHSTLHQEV